MIVHKTALVELHHADAIDVLPTIGTESLDLAITDPPYGQEWRSNRRADSFDQLLGDGSDEENRADVRQILAELVRVVGQNRHLYVFGPTDVLDGLKVSEPSSLVWDKTRMGSGDRGRGPRARREPISFVVSKHRHGGKAGTGSLAARLRKGSVLRFAPPTGRNVRHPSEKPVALLRELVESSSRQGETVVDPYAGTGSTGVAALLSGRRAVLVEKDPRYVEIALERVKAAEALAEEASSC